MAFEVRNYLENPPSEAEIAEVLKKAGIHARELIRTGEAVYKEKFKGKELSEEDWIKAMAENPILIERPVIIRGKKGPPEKVSEIL